MGFHNTVEGRVMYFDLKQSGNGVKDGDDRTIQCQLGPSNMNEIFNVYRLRTNDM